MDKNQNSKPGTSKTLGKSRIISVIVAAVCIVIYLFALVQAAVRLYLSADKIKLTAEYEFSQIAKTALNAGNQGFMTQRYIDTINNALSASKSLEALIITGPDGEYVFEKQKGYAVNWVNNSPRFINRAGFSNQSHYEPLPIQNLRNANIKAVSRAFDYIDFTKILKETLLIILAGFAIAFFTMLFQLLTAKQDPMFVKIKSDKSADLENHFTYEADIPLPEIGPKGLYSPRSNIGWEDYLNDRLDAELHRCASTEKDLAFVLIEFTDLTNDAMFKQSTEDAVPSFTSRDLLFEYGRWGIAAIIPGTSLENAISKAEKFYQLIMDKFPRGHDAPATIFIGITSRSGRLLGAERLLLEAREALKKAKADPKSPIIAFKSDPEKYREFISSQNK
ncbi:MAG: hypothetical protein FWB86_07055 [Treponema sp.]|nr:hypothetical protein [Treponema sp.]MCL2251984.1 hypothetical protein [Treponema sp.]